MSRHYECAKQNFIFKEHGFFCYFRIRIRVTKQIPTGITVLVNSGNREWR